MFKNYTKLFHARPLFYGFLALLLAISTTKYLFDGNVLYILFDLFILISFFTFCILRKRFFAILGVFTIFFFGIGWYFLGIYNFNAKAYLGDCQIVGRVSDDLNFSSYQNYVSFTLKDVVVNGEKTKNIDLKINLNENEDINVGDIILFQKDLVKVAPFTLGNFNSHYYRKNIGYSAEIDFAELSIQGNSLNADEKFRLHIKDSLYKNMGKENGAVAFAVLFGDKSDVDFEIKDSYRTAGIIHLLTVSGLHVGFLIVLLGYILKKCRVGGIFNFLICFLILSLYAYVCGFPPSVLRAGIMGLVLLATKLSGKCYDNLNSLGLSGIIILLFSPLSGLDAGFLMSFFCVLGIFVIGPGLINFLSKIFPKVIAESFAISISAQIGILPFIASFHSNFNFLSIFANLLVIPLFSILYPLLFISAILVSIMPFLGFMLTVCGWGFAVIYKVALLFSNNYFILELKPFNPFFVMFLFVLLFLISKFFMCKKNLKILICSVLSCVCVLSFGLSYLKIKPDCSLSYSCNNGSGIVCITNSNGDSIMVDWGSSGFTKQFLEVNRIYDLSACLILNKNSKNLKTMQDIGVKNIIKCYNGNESSIIQNVKPEQYEAINGFSFVYKEIENRIVGIEISFDNTKVFIFKNSSFKLEIFEKISLLSYDFVIFGKNTEFSNCFENVITIGFDDKNLDFSYVRDGNVKYNIRNKNYKRSSLD